ncbi:hypothetical protein [Amycolatopsis rifamycinica]|uniref:hypothetical protein n=1 Tax=Amycolatopsis rifamycinica TaxID=287986 RepID=UPI00126A3659|nr:hypothetical protein [Amycolatopsis rifamycinica]
MAQWLASRDALIDLPEWIWGGDPFGMARDFGWKMVFDQEQQAYRVGLAERRARQSPKLIDLKKLAHAGNIDSPGSFSELKTLPPQSSFISIPVEVINHEIQRISRNDTGLGAVFSQITTATLSCHENQLPELIRDVFRETLLESLPGACAWLLKINKALQHRFTIPRVLLALEHDPRMRTDRPEDGAKFRSANGLYSDTMMGLGSYLAPLLLSLSPWVWGIDAARAGGVVIYTFGQEVPGRRHYPPEPLQKFHPSTPTVIQSRKVRVSVDGADIEESLHWWTRKLNELFAELTDPSNSVDSSGRLDPRRQLERILSVEQIFRNVQSISALDRDRHAARMLCFDTLDCLSGLKLLDFEPMCTASKAEACLDEIKGELPARVAKVLLPRAEVAVQALKDLQDGFFMSSLVDPDGRIELPDDVHGSRKYEKDRAVALWLRMLRNAGHSFGGRPTSRGDTLLIAHNGEVPPDFPDLAYLYLLRLITFPELLRDNRRSPLLGLRKQRRAEGVG